MGATASARGRFRGRAVGARIALARRQKPVGFSTLANQKRLNSGNSNVSARGSVQSRLSFNRVQHRGAPGIANRARANFNRNYEI